MADFSSENRRNGRCVDPRRAGACAVALLACLVVCGLSPLARGGTLITITTSLGTIHVDLFDDLAPTTVTNFLSYVNSNALNSTLVHRSTSIADTGIAVIQGGGFTYDAGTGDFVGIDTDDPIPLEYNRPNTRGTIAMARQGGFDTTTATSQWFINASDNSTALGRPGTPTVPSNQYTVFGWVVGTGMSVVDAINNLNKSTVDGFPGVPLRNWTSGPVSQANLVFTSDITASAQQHPSFQNPVMNSDVVNDGRLRASDAHALINDLLANGSHNVVGPFSGTRYLDVNGSNTVTSADLNIVISSLLALNASQQAAPAAAGPMAAPMVGFMTVPEPATVSLAAAAMAVLALYVAGRKRRPRL